VAPIVQAMLLADHVYVDRVSGKHIIAGTFTHIHRLRKPIAQQLQRTSEGGAEAAELAESAPQPVAEKPVAEMLPGPLMGSPHLYLCLTEVTETDLKLQLRFVDLNDLRVLFEIGLELNIVESDRFKVHEIPIQLPQLPITVAGTYSLELLYQDALLGQCRINVFEHTALNTPL